MTVAASTPLIEYTENGVTLAFAVPWRFLAAAHLVVTRIAVDGTVTQLVQGTHWSATGGTTDAGGTLTLVASVNGAKLRIARATPLSQADDYIPTGKFPADTLEGGFDRAMMGLQDAAVARADVGNRALQVPVGETVNLLPKAADRKGTVLGFNATTGQPEAGPKIADVQTLAQVTAAIGTVASNIGSVNTVAGIAANVVSVAGIGAAVATVAGIAANVTAVAGNASNVNTVAGNIANVNLVAGVAPDLSSILAIQGQIVTVAGIAAHVTTVAGVAAHVTTVAGIAGNVTAVAGNAGNVNTVAGSIANVNALGPVASGIATLAPIASGITTVAGISGAVSTVAGISTHVAAVSGIAADVTAVAGIAANVTTVAGAAGNVATVGSNIASVNTVAADLALGASSAIVQAPAAAASASASATSANSSANRAEAAAAYRVSIAYATWAELAAITGTSGQTAAVFNDAGTHTDPVVGGTVANNGVYSYSVSPAGWRRQTGLPSVLSDGDKGDIIVASGGLAWTIDAGAVDYTKIQAVSAASRLLGRGAGAGAGVAQELSLGALLALSGTTLGISGTLAQFNTACTDADFVSLAGAETLTNKTLGLVASTASAAALNIPHGATVTTVVDGDVWSTSVGFFARISGVTRQFAMINGAQTLTSKTIALGSNSVSGTLAEFNAACTDADFASLAGAETLTNKTLALGNNTISGALAQFNTACTDADFVSLAGAETLTNKTLTGPAISSPTVTGPIALNGSVRGQVESAGGTTLDCSTGNHFTRTVSSNTSFSFSNVPAGSYSCLLEIDWTAGTVTLPAGTKTVSGKSIKWATGKWWVLLSTSDGGTNWQANAVGPYV